MRHPEAQGVVETQVEEGVGVETAEVAGTVAEVEAARAELKEVGMTVGMMEVEGLATA